MIFTEDSILRCLLRKRFLKNLLMPRYTPKDWWECDLFEVTPAGYFCEYEIKTSRSDFFNDQKKADMRCSYYNIQSKKIANLQDSPDTKHKRLSNRCPPAPNRFYFVIPVGLVKIEEIPEWAGLIVVGENNKTIYENEIKTAPVLHREKRPSVESQIHKACYYRYHGLLVKKELR